MRIYMLVVGIALGGWYLKTKYLGTFNLFEGALNVAENHPDPVWSPRLEYWVAIAYYQKSDYPKAQTTFAKLLTDYPTSQYTPKALYRHHFAARENRDWSAAMTSLERYIDQFPDGDDIDTAKSSFDKLKYEHPDEYVPIVSDYYD